MRTTYLRGMSYYLRIDIVGSTDVSGSPELNQRLSRVRAERVRQALIASGAPAASLQSRGDAMSRRDGDEDRPASGRRVSNEVVGRG